MGKVQKTGFLFYIKQFSGIYHINGFAKYTGDDSIFIEAEGEETNLEEFLKYCRIGPDGAVINSIKIFPSKPRLYTSFKIFENSMIDTTDTMSQ